MMPSNAMPVTVVILAAGLGTRMKSRKAKVLHRAGGKALVQHVVETARELAPPERIFVVVGYQADEVRRAVSTPGIGFIEQAEQKGTGHALMVGRDALAGLREEYRKLLVREGKATPASFRELTGLTRKFIIPLMEYFDMTKLTMRAGEHRILRERQEK